MKYYFTIFLNASQAEVIHPGFDSLTACSGFMQGYLQQLNHYVIGVGCFSTEMLNNIGIFPI